MYLLYIRRMLAAGTSTAACSARLHRYAQASLTHPGMLNLAAANPLLRAASPGTRASQLEKVAFAIAGGCADSWGAAGRAVQAPG